VPLPFVFPIVRHRTSNCSGRVQVGGRGECELELDLIIRSERISNLTFPTRGIRPHAIGEVHSAAEYATRPETVGRWGCVEGKRWRVICGERISCGRGDCSKVGMRSWRMRRAIPFC
jgi:hypothetical protein